MQIEQQMVYGPPRGLVPAIPLWAQNEPTTGGGGGPKKKPHAKKKPTKKKK
jgi:hypothetical protein